MFAELLTVERNDLMRDLLATYPYKPYLWALGKEREGAVDNYILSQINEAVKAGGIARTYYLDGRVQGLCVIKPDHLATRELNIRAYRITHLLAMGKPDVQMLIKNLLIRETLRTLPKNSCVVARCPYSDLTSINALESCGFFTTHTALVLAKDLTNNDWLTTPAEDYEVTPLDPNYIDNFDESVLDIPEGILGWDVNLPRRVLSKVHRDWLRTYAAPTPVTAVQSKATASATKSNGVNQAVFAAVDHGRIVGIVAERTKPYASHAFGFNVGSIDILTTAPEYRGNGVATQLLKESLNQFAQNGVRVAELIVHSSDGVQSHSYQEMGFFTVGTTLTLAYCGGKQPDRAKLARIRG